jgi:amidase
MTIEKLLWETDAVGLGGLVNQGEVTPAELVDAAIARAETVNPAINAIAERLYDQARETAARVDRALPLAGVPFAIKDLGVALRGVPVHTGSRVPSFTADYDSVMVERYRAAGLVPIATSTTPEYGLRLVTESAAFGITRNPWNTDHTSGGSSGGAASLVAAGIVPVAHASDGGGSIRVPAACCGLVGLKTSRGRIPQTPLVSEGWFGFIVDHVVSRSVRDSALLLDLTHGPDPLAPYAARPPRHGTFADAAARDPGRLALGVYRKSPLGLEISTETMAALDRAVELAREGGHDVEEIDLPMVDRAFMADFARIVAASIAGLARTESLRTGRPVAASLERGTRIIARFGEIFSAGDLCAGLERLHSASRALIAHTARFDAVLMPLIAHPPVPVGGMEAKGADAFTEDMLDKLRLTRLLKLDQFLGQLMDKSLWFTHWPAIQNVTGQPSIAMPVHVTASGLPLGIQAAGRPGDEETLLSFAAQMEKISGWTGRRAGLMRPD